MMKLFYGIMLGAITLLAIGCKTTKIVNEPPRPPKGEVELNEFGMPILLEYTPSHVDLGKIKKGDKRTLEFEYKNISNELVEIEIVSACSCTETEYTVSSMQPNEGGKILLVFDSSPKDKSETIDVDIILKNTEPKNGYPIVDRVTFSYELVDENGNPYVAPKKKE